jgi:multisubunit Na+/H+ antiporter MnhE subunit
MERQPTSVGGWILTLFLLSIPVLNIIMIIVWLIGDTEPSKKNFIIASIIYSIIFIVLYMLFIGALIASMGSM